MLRDWLSLPVFLISFFCLPGFLLGEKAELKSIKVSLIGKKTRVSFILSGLVPYTLNHLDGPPRLMVDFKEDISGDLDSVKVFNMGFVKNVRSYFIEGQGGAPYLLDVCVIELDRPCETDVFEQDGVLHVDCMEKAALEKERSEADKKEQARKKAVKLYQQGLASKNSGDYEGAADLLRQSLEADETFLEAKAPLNDVERLISEREKRIRKEASALEKEFSRKIRSEQDEAEDLEKEMIGKKKEALSLHFDIQDLEQKGLIAYRDKDYQKALDYWNQALEISPENREIATLMAKAHKEMKKASRVLEGQDPAPVSLDNLDNVKAKALGRFEVREFAGETLLRFPIEGPVSYRYAALKEPYRIMIYFKESVASDMDENYEIGSGGIIRLRAYLSTLGSPENDGKVKKIDALIAELDGERPFKIAQSDKCIQITIRNKEQAAEMPEESATELAPVEASGPAGTEQ